MGKINNIGISKGLEVDIFEAAKKSIEKGNKDGYLIVASFIRSALQVSIKNKSLPHFQEFIFTYSNAYAFTFEKAKENQKISALLVVLIENSARSLTGIIKYDINWIGKSFKSYEDKMMLNNFYYWSLTSIGRLFYYIIKYQDKSSFDLIIDNLEQLTDGQYDENYELNFKIKLLKSTNADGAQTEKIAELEKEYEVSNKFYVYQRHLLLGVKSWIIYLYHLGKLNSSDTEFFIEKIKIQYNESSEMLDDILFFKYGTHIMHNYFEFNSWDFVKRPDGKMYTPPSPDEWLTLGFIIEQLRGNTLIIDYENLDKLALKNTVFLLGDLTGYIKMIQEDYAKWKPIIKVDSEQELKEKCDAILEAFTKLKNINTGSVNLAIANSELSEEKINNFKNLIGESWKNYSRIHKLFRAFGNKEIITDNETILKRFGTYTFLERGKTLFIDGEHHHNIYGIERWGGDIGLWEDNAFFNEIFSRSINIINGYSFVETIEKCLTFLKNKDVTASVILIPPDYSRSRLYQDSRFVMNNKRNGKGEDIKDFKYGDFLNVPVFISTSNFLKGNVIVTDFEAAFKMLYRENTDWYNNELEFKISEVTPEEAQRRLDENPEKWKNTEDGLTITNNDALTLIKTSVNVQFWTYLDFKIKDAGKFVVGQVNTELN